MSTPTESVSHAAAKAVLLAIQASANAEFIANADLAIAEAITHGKFHVYLYSVKHMKFQDILDYYIALGYVIGAPNFQSFGCQPAELFGSFWVDYWGHIWHTNRRGRLRYKPYQVVISWSL